MEDTALNIKKSKDHYDKGISMFFLNPQVPKEELNPEKYFYYYSKLPEKYKEHFNISLEVLNFRNKVMVFVLFEIISAIIGGALFALRRSIPLIVINSLILVLCFVGLGSLIYMAEAGIILYTLMTTSLPIAFFLYQLYEYFFITNKGRTDAENVISEQLFLGLVSVPYLYDCFCGFLNLYLINLIGHFNKEIKEIEKKDKEEEDQVMLNEEEIREIKGKYSEDSLEEEFKKREGLKKDNCNDNINLLCIICCTNTRNVICNPCHDLLMCLECSEKLKEKFNLHLVCPKCRREITSFERIYT